MTLEKRRFHRYDVAGLEGTLILSFEVKVVDLSLTGMAVETRTALKVGSSYSVRTSHRGAFLRFPATVRWCHLVRTEHDPLGDDVVPIYRAGLDFRDGLEERARSLLELIEDHIVVDLDRRQQVAGRFAVNVGGDTVSVGEPSDFIAHRLSLSGMLVETTVTPPPTLGAVLDVHVSHHSIQLHARAHVAYVEVGPESVARGTFLGLEFEGLTPAAVRAIEALVEAEL